MRKDGVGRRVPTYLGPVFDSSRKIGRLGARIALVMNSLEQTIPLRGGSEEIDFQKICNALEFIYVHLQENRPHSVCYKCLNRGERWGGCECKGRGWLTLTQMGTTYTDQARRRSVRRAINRRVRVERNRQQVRLFLEAGDFSRDALAELSRYELKLLLNEVKRDEALIAKMPESYKRRLLPDTLGQLDREL